MAPENVIVTRWPRTIKGYPKRGEPHSWVSIFEHVRDQLAVRCHLHGRPQSKTGKLPAELTLRGAYSADAFKYIWAESRAAGINLNGVPALNLLSWEECQKEERESSGSGVVLVEAASSSSSKATVVVPGEAPPQPRPRPPWLCLMKPPQPRPRPPWLCPVRPKM